jgi:hypothetical protein
MNLYIVAHISHYNPASNSILHSMNIRNHLCACIWKHRGLVIRGRALNWYIIYHTQVHYHYILFVFMYLPHMQTEPIKESAYWSILTVKSQALMHIIRWAIGTKPAEGLPSIHLESHWSNIEVSDSNHQLKKWRNNIRLSSGLVIKGSYYTLLYFTSHKSTKFSI